MADNMIGKIDGKILEAILETIPIEFSVLDEGVRYWLGINMKLEYLKDLKLL
ncbi:MAG: hypothetical protein APG12_00937 [Candidatus Methanofastidiosum methylothiophilum]|uniref:Uncharacterized protein n=1 Tax=Candidatus Methanofastidiosum methylothiophilum TaxID=1705564 RepID=A0A150IRU9_9EURY|nr:MAG: hypothetical protein APG10_00751 [Candidatus Methanofastidiosum methylthiophilus]KYC47598.1 MAG: hypothetical protein APG11_01004 [Candidatus Methanofastidiosum methylthiophilus]KYC50215.1 MAG: hypothetical protein APG12_00937 [Candidatus Methanofastidiosum methylthiophilus]